MLLQLLQLQVALHGNARQHGVPRASSTVAVALQATHGLPTEEGEGFWINRTKNSLVSCPSSAAAVVIRGRCR